ncbi:MAG: photosynthetic reaction center cytochrome PufC [Pseudomonadales bacterium]
MQTSKRALTVWLGSVLSLMLLSGCELPPMDSEQQGFRGTGMVQINNPESTVVTGEVPEAAPLAPAAGPKAGDLYQNVQVLGDLSIGEFTRLMAAMTEWVAPEEGCNHCHVGGDLASDDIYTKVVSRRMLEMTQTLNASYTPHVGNTGVTCYTCHRGKNVPENIWTLDDAPPRAANAGWRAGQNQAGTSTNGFTSLPYDPFRKYFAEQMENLGGIRVASTTALPTTDRNPQNIKDAEETYALMMHLSESLGVNCTFCHNSRAFASWEESSPARVKAWHGLGMVQAVNEQFLAPLASALPAERKGLSGDAPKVNCASCHQGQNKPLGGAEMAKHYPALLGKR